MSKSQWVENEFGILIEEEFKFEKRDKMTREEWRAYFSQEEISEDEFKAEYAKYRRPLDA